VTDRSADIDVLGLPARPTPARRLGKGVRLLVAGAVALALMLSLALAWLQIAVLSDLPSTEALHPPPGPPPTPAEAKAGDSLAPALADRLLPPQGPAARRALQREALTLKLRRELRPDEIRRLYLERTAPPPQDLAREAEKQKFYQGLAADFADAEDPGPALRTDEK
jgi:hypothetical protein